MVQDSRVPDTGPWDVLKEYDIREVLLGMMNEKQRKQFEDGQDVDFAWQTTDAAASE